RPLCQHDRLDADRLLRAQGNRSGRLRMRPDGSLRACKPPRGLILSTGEDLPRGQSLRSRVLVFELGRSDVEWSRLTDCQAHAGAMSSGRAHVAAPDGNRPNAGGGAWGWRLNAYGTHEPMGDRVGWLDGEDLYLDPDAAYAAVQRLGQEIGDRIALTPQTLRKRLKER